MGNKNSTSSQDLATLAKDTKSIFILVLILFSLLYPTHAGTGKIRERKPHAFFITFILSRLHPFSSFLPSFRISRSG
jgi:hypothetical protein